MRQLILLVMILLSSTRGAWARTRVATYTPEQAQKYLTTCVEKAKASAPPFISETFFQNYCQCTLNYIQERVSYEDFRSMAIAQSQKQPLTPMQQQAADVLDESLKVCFTPLGARFK